MNGASQLLARESKPAHPSPAVQNQPGPFGRVTVTRLLLAFVLPMTSGLLLYLCYFPVAWGALGWVALVPFLLLVRTSMGNFFRYTTAFAIGYAFYCPVLQWIRVADDRMYLAWLALALCCALFFPAGLLWRRLWVVFARPQPARSAGNHPDCGHHRCLWRDIPTRGFQRLDR
jgi:hypothetical protein